MKSMKKILAVILVVIMTMSILTACGEDSTNATSEGAVSDATVESTAAPNPAAGTYECFIFDESDAETVQTAFHGGYLSAMTTVKQVNTLVLNDDYTYSYTKRITGTREGQEGTVDLSAVFTGIYTVEGDRVTLAYPDDCEYTHDWAFFDGFLFSETGIATNGDLIEDQFQSLQYFPTPIYPKDPIESTDSVNVTINITDDSFSYND